MCHKTQPTNFDQYHIPNSSCFLLQLTRFINSMSMRNRLKKKDFFLVERRSHPSVEDTVIIF